MMNSLRVLSPIILLVWSQVVFAQKLQVSFDRRGIASLSYGGVSLIDLNGGRGDAFSVGAYQLGGKSGWGETGKTESWDDAKRLLTWAWNWGSVSCQFVEADRSDALQIRITVADKSSEALEGIAVSPLGLQYPQLPRGFGAPNYPQFHNNLDAPALIAADFGQGITVIADENAKGLYVGLSPSGTPNHYKLQIGTNNDDSKGFLSRAVPVHRPLPPGQTDSYVISLRFAPSGTEVSAITKDILKNYSRIWPQTLRWSDRRPIGELFITDPTSSPRAEAIPNPRNYNFSKEINIHTTAGKAAFRAALLSYADRAVQLLHDMNAQGAIVWDLEGQQYPQPDTSYAGSPDQLFRLSPEIDAVADEFFRKFKNAGLGCGLTIRPQRLDFSTSPPRQKDVPAQEGVAVMIGKVQYARKRWGCNIFYVDSDGGPNDATTPSSFAQVLEKLPGVLIIPENIWPKDYAYTAPLASYTAPYKPLHTSSYIRAIWPEAFTVTYIGDAPNHDLKRNPRQWVEFREAVRGGDILTFRAWFDDEPLNSQIRELYREAKR
ncbi:MAG: hypothetical protein JO185_22710 [Acidobacteriaceae bacterium]|nr:hypothetical protein [Acidobacteriaceae bacterium]